MTSKAQTLDTAFIHQQRQRLAKLRAALLAAAHGESQEASANTGEDPGPREFEDDAQKLTLLELEEHLVRRDLDRLARVERALRKIDEGSYGRSDLSGRPIPRERLEAVPEALSTLAEEEEQERGQGHGQGRRPM
jgi:DnaK suppressor protein